MDHNYAKKPDIENNYPDFMSGESEVEEIIGEEYIKIMEKLQRIKDLEFRHQLLQRK